MADGSPCGFDGFMAYRTDVETAIAQADQLASAPPVAPAATRQAAAAEAPTHRDSGAIAAGVKKIGGWVIGIGLIVAVKACFFAGVHTMTSSTPSTTYDAAPTGTDTTANTADQGSASTADTSPPLEPSDDGATLTKPEAGASTLTMAELRYCLAEDIRIGAEKSAMDDLQRSDTERFNQHVDDYNNAVSDRNLRCSHHSYVSSQKPLAEGQVEAQRAALELEGRSRVD